MDLKNMNKKLLIIVSSVVAVFVVIIIAISLFMPKTLSYNKIINKMESAAKKYYQENSDKLPSTENGQVSVGITELETSKYLTPISKMVKKGTVCNGEVRVIKNDDNYLYIPYLNCGEEYATEELYKQITSNVVTEGDGLYNINGEYIFRGELVNNYVKFAGKTWRIIKVDANNNIKLAEEDKEENVIWDDRYNVEKNSNFGYNDFMVSRIHDSLQARYNDGKTFSDSTKASIVSTQLCIGKRDETYEGKDGAVECSIKTEEAEPIGLMQLNEYMMASLDDNCKKSTDEACQNYNYLNSYSKTWWAITGDSSRSYRVYRISNSGASITNASSNASMRMTLVVNSNIIYKSGNGTKSNPYQI